MPDSIPPYVTSKQAARLLDVSLRTIQLWVENGTLGAWKTPGGHRRIYAMSIRTQLDKRKIGYQPPAQKPKEINPSLKVIAVDDDPLQLELIKILIKRSAIDITLYTASDGYEGLVSIGNHQPDLAIIDLSMPNINGFEMIRELSKNEITKNMKILVVSGLSDREIASNGGLPAFVTILQKPIMHQQLEPILEQTLHLKQPDDLG